MPKPKRQVLSLSRFAALKGVSRQAVHKAIERGDIPPEAIAWRGKGKRRVVTIVNVPLASTWTPAGREGSLADEKPGELTDASSARDAKRILLIFKAKQARIEFEQASDKLIDREAALALYGGQVSQARNALLNLPTKARARLPHLAAADAVVLEELIRDVLTDLADGPPKKAGRRRGPR